MSHSPAAPYLNSNRVTHRQQRSRILPPHPHIFRHGREKVSPPTPREPGAFGNAELGDANLTSHHRPPTRESKPNYQWVRHCRQAGPKDVQFLSSSSSSAPSARFRPRRPEPLAGDDDAWRSRVRTTIRSRAGDLIDYNVLGDSVGCLIPNDRTNTNQLQRPISASYRHRP